MTGKLDISLMSSSTSQFYDNIALGSLVIETVIGEFTQLSLAKAILILPLLLHDPIIKRLSTSTKYRSIDEFLIKERSNLGDFNLRMENMLPLSVNCISLLKEVDRISQNGPILIATNVKKNIQKIDIGIRANKILRIVVKSKFLFEEDDASTYLKFNISL